MQARRSRWVRWGLFVLLSLPVVAYLTYVSPLPQWILNYEFARDLPRFRMLVTQSGSLTLYEGLPHQRFEEALLQQELAQKQTTNSGGFPFYAEQISPSPADAKRLKDIYCQEGAFTPRLFGVVWRCGGYHPDYCLVWGEAASICLVQICFGCQQMKTFAGGKELYCQISSAACSDLKQLLVAYQRNRPKTEFSPKVD